jgi:hypothetical protein
MPVSGNAPATAGCPARRSTTEAVAMADAAIMPATRNVRSSIRTRVPTGVNAAAAIATAANASQVTWAVDPNPSSSDPVTAGSAENTKSVSPTVTRAVTKVGIVWAVGVVVGSAVLFGIPSPVTVIAPGARAAIETLIASSALLSGALLLVSFRQRHQQSDLLLGHTAANHRWGTYS